jgi:hypothetical protein
MRSTIELSDIHDIVLVLEDCSLVVVYIQVIRSTKDGNNGRKASRSGLSVHSIA